MSTRPLTVLLVNPTGEWVSKSDYDALEAEWMSLSQDDGKVERALESAQGHIRELQAEIHRLNMEMSAYRQGCTPAMLAVIDALKADKMANCKHEYYGGLTPYCKYCGHLMNS